MIKIIGLGGIGSHLVGPLCRSIDSTSGDKPRIIVIDGKQYTARKADRQEFLDVGNKAEMTVMRMRRDFPELSVEARSQFVSEENIFFMINRGDIVLMGVDNHATRRMVSDHCETLDDIVLISGGNEVTDGNIQIHIRRGGEEVTPPITYLHPEIAHAQDRNPADMSCEELEERGGTQIIFTNLTAATLMLNAYWMVQAFLSGEGKLVYSDQYFDLLTGNVRSELRKRPAKTTTKER